MTSERGATYESAENIKQQLILAHTHTHTHTHTRARTKKLECGFYILTLAVFLDLLGPERRYDDSHKKSGANVKTFASLHAALHAFTQNNLF